MYIIPRLQGWHVLLMRVLVMAIAGAVASAMIVFVLMGQRDHQRIMRTEAVIRETRQIVEETGDQEARKIFEFFMARKVIAAPEAAHVRYLERPPVDPLAIVSLFPGDETISRSWNWVSDASRQSAFYESKKRWIVLLHLPWSLRTRALINLHEIKHAYEFAHTPLVRTKGYPVEHELETHRFHWRLMNKMSHGGYEREMVRYLSELAKRDDHNPLFEGGALYLSAATVDVSRLCGEGGKPLCADEEEFLRSTFMVDAALRYSSRKLKGTHAHAHQVRLFRSSYASALHLR